MTPPPRRRPVVAGHKARQRRPVTPPPLPVAADFDEQASAAVVDPRWQPDSVHRGDAPGNPGVTGRVPTPAQGRIGWLLTAGLTLVVLLLAGALWLAAGWRADPGAQDQARVDALAAARSASVDLLSINYQGLEAGKKKATAHLAPKFRADYTKFFTALQSTAVKNQLVLSANVVAGGVIRVKDRHHVVVLLFIDQISTNAVRSSPRIDQNRVRLRMVESHGRWLVEGLDAL